MNVLSLSRRCCRLAGCRAGRSRRSGRCRCWSLCLGGSRGCCCLHRCGGVLLLCRGLRHLRRCRRSTLYCRLRHGVGQLHGSRRYGHRAGRSRCRGGRHRGGAAGCGSCSRRASLLHHSALGNLNLTGSCIVLRLDIVDLKREIRRRTAVFYNAHYKSVDALHRRVQTAFIASTMPRSNFISSRLRSMFTYL